MDNTPTLKITFHNVPLDGDTTARHRYVSNREGWIVLIDERKLRHGDLAAVMLHEFRHALYGQGIKTRGHQDTRAVRDGTRSPTHCDG